MVPAAAQGRSRLAAAGRARAALVHGAAAAGTARLDESRRLRLRSLAVRARRGRDRGAARRRPPPRRPRRSFARIDRRSRALRTRADHGGGARRPAAQRRDPRAGGRRPERDPARRLDAVQPRRNLASRRDLGAAHHDARRDRRVAVHACLASRRAHRLDRRTRRERTGVRGGCRSRRGRRLHGARGLRRAGAAHARDAGRGRPRAPDRDRCAAVSRARARPDRRGRVGSLGGARARLLALVRSGRLPDAGRPPRARSRRARWSHRTACVRGDACPVRRDDRPGAGHAARVPAGLAGGTARQRSRDPARELCGHAAGIGGSRNRVGQLAAGLGRGLRHARRLARVAGGVAACQPGVAGARALDRGARHARSRLGRVAAGTSGAGGRPGLLRAIAVAGAAAPGSGQLRRDDPRCRPGLGRARRDGEPSPALRHRAALRGRQRCRAARAAAAAAGARHRVARCRGAVARRQRPFRRHALAARAGRGRAAARRRDRCTLDGCRHATRGLPGRPGLDLGRRDVRRPRAERCRPAGAQGERAQLRAERGERNRVAAADRRHRGGAGTRTGAHAARVAARERGDDAAPRQHDVLQRRLRRCGRPATRRRSDRLAQCLRPSEGRRRRALRGRRRTGVADRRRRRDRDPGLAAGDHGAMLADRGTALLARRSQPRLPRASGGRDEIVGHRPQHDLRERFDGRLPPATKDSHERPRLGMLPTTHPTEFPWTGSCCSRRPSPCSHWSIR